MKTDTTDFHPDIVGQDMDMDHWIVESCCNWNVDGGRMKCQYELKYHKIFLEDKD